MKLKDELAESKAITEREISLRDGKEKNGSVSRQQINARKFIDVCLIEIGCSKTPS